MSNKIAIVGVGESDEIGKVPGKSPLQHHAEAAYNALEDAGISIDQVDGLLTAGYSSMVVAEYLGITPTFTDGTNVGGSSFIIHIAHAMAAIRAGYCNVVLVTHGQAGRSARTRAIADAAEPGSQFEAPYGIVNAPAAYSLAASRYMHIYGEDRTRDAMAEIAVSTRKWAQINPKAYMRDPMTKDDYHNSRWVAWPFHLLDCCIVTDAGGAYVITSADVAKDLKKQPVWVLGAAESHDHAIISQMPDLTSPISKDTGARAFGMAGVVHSDIDLAMIYDSFTYTVLLTLEDLGFCGKGEGPDFIKSKTLGPGGDFAMNTSGGGLSYTHSGMYGMFLVVEAVTQLRGEAGDRQLDVCNTALVHGTGGSLSSGGTTLLGID